MPMKMYYLFLEPLQLESLKKIVEHYFRDSAGSGFDNQVRELVTNAKFLEELAVDWGAKQTDQIISRKQEPDWSFMWALRELDSLSHHIRTVAAKYVTTKMKQERLILHLRNIHNALDPAEPEQGLRDGIIDAKKYIAELFQKNKLKLEVEPDDKVSSNA